MQRAAHPPVRARLAAQGRLTVPAHIAVGSARVAAVLAGLAAGAGALAIAAGPGRATTYAGISAAGAALTVCVGAGLIAAGLVVWRSRLPGPTGDLALLAAVIWFAPVWVAWQDGPPLIASVAMVAAGFMFPLIVHLALSYPTGSAGSWPGRLLVTSVYAEALLAGGVLAMFRNPYFDPGCLANCTVNAFLVRSLPSLAHAVQIGDRWFTATAAFVLIAVCVTRLARASRPARRLLFPVQVPAALLAAAMIARATALQKTMVEDPFNTALFTIFAAGSIALILLATGLMSAVVRARAERRAVARIGASLDRAPAPGSLQSALGAALRDPGLQIAYWLPGQQGYVDAKGQPVPEPSAALGRAVTRLTRNGSNMAAISHSGVAASIESQIGPATRLALDNERLQAELFARLDELRASRARIVQAADAERRRIERDLHDGAQQRLLAVSYDIRLAHSSALEDGNTVAAMALANAAEDTRDILKELRDLAHGIYPAVLAEAGIGPALATLADTAPLPVEIRQAGHSRYPESVEATAYFAVAEAVDDAARRGADYAAVSVACDSGKLIVTVEDNAPGEPSSMVAAADRVGALGGSLSTELGRCCAEIPCASS